MATIIDAPFGKLVIADWMPKGTLMAISPGEKTVVTDESGQTVGEFWTREPSGVIVKNIGGRHEH